MYSFWFGSELLTAMANNLTPNILKVDLSSYEDLEDKHVKMLVKRCNKITELNLNGCTSITNDSVDSIATHLKSSLVQLDVSFTKIDSTALLQLRSVRTLKVLCYLNETKIKEIKNLRKNLPQVSFIDIDGCSMVNTIASPFVHHYRVCADYDKHGFWEIKADKQELFKYRD